MTTKVVKLILFSNPAFYGTLLSKIRLSKRSRSQPLNIFMSYSLFVLNDLRVFISLLLHN